MIKIKNKYDKFSAVPAETRTAACHVATNTSFPKILAVRAALKVVLAVLLHWPMTSESDTGGMALEREPTKQICFSVDHLQERILAST